MCFVLYMAADTPIPDIPFDREDPRLNTQPLTEGELPVQGLFQQRSVKCLGSSSHCGCGYRHLSYQEGEWPEEYLIGTDPEFGRDTQEDHESLRKFLIDQLQHNEKIELCGCWDGDDHDPPARHERVCVDDLVRVEFFLRERCHYTVTLNSSSAEGG